MAGERKLLIAARSKCDHNRKYEIHGAAPAAPADLINGLALPGDLQKSVVNKIEELDDLYSLVRSEIEARRMLLLEVTIVGLFVLDLVVLLWKG